MASEVYVRVSDRAGNEFLCPLSKLRDPKNMSEEDLENCVDEAVAQRYAGDIKIKE